MLKKGLVGLAVLMGVFVVVVIARPSEFRIERSTRIDAPVDVVFAKVNDFAKWDVWSPWARLDPDVITKIDGPPAGVGSRYSWVGDDRVGEGRMTITESRPNERVGIKLEFVRPWGATNTATFVFDARGRQTKVTWAMEGRNNFTAKAFGLFADLEAEIGRDFEKGLAQLKAVSEAERLPRADEKRT